MRVKILKKNSAEGIGLMGNQWKIRLNNERYILNFIKWNRIKKTKKFLSWFHVNWFWKTINSNWRWVYSLKTF